MGRSYLFRLVKSSLCCHCEVPPPVAEKRGPSTEPPVAHVIPTKDPTENGSSQAAEPSLLNNVFGFARSNFSSFEKAQQTPVTEPPRKAEESVAEKSQEKSQKNLEEGADEIPTPPSILPDSIIKSETEVIKRNSQETPPDPEGATKSIPEADSTSVQSETEASQQQASDSAPVEKVEDGVKREEVHISPENSSGPEMVSPTAVTEQEAGKAKDEVDTAIQEDVLVLQQPQASVPLEKSDEDVKEKDPVDLQKQDNGEEHPAAGPPEISANEEKLEKSPNGQQHPSSNIVAAETHVIGDDDMEEESDERSVAVATEGVVDSGSDLALSRDFTQQQFEVPELPAEGIEPREESVPLPAEPAVIEKPAAIEKPAVIENSESPLAKESKELIKLRNDLKMMEAALHGAAKQSQVGSFETSLGRTHH